MNEIILQSMPIYIANGKRYVNIDATRAYYETVATFCGYRVDPNDAIALCFIDNHTEERFYIYPLSDEENTGKGEGGISLEDITP